MAEQTTKAVIAPNDQTKEKTERKMPPVSKAKGGLMPGIDLTRYSDIQAMDDLEYGERLKNGFE
jgi:hypothetical protein